MFTITGNKGFHLTFDNGLTLSTQIEGGNYCSNYYYDIMAKENPPKCKNAEIAIINKEDSFITGEVLKGMGIDNDESVAGHVLFKDWLKIVDHIKGL